MNNTPYPSHGGIEARPDWITMRDAVFRITAAGSAQSNALAALAVGAMLQEAIRGRLLIAEPSYRANHVLGARSLDWDLTTIDAADFGRWCERVKDNPELLLPNPAQTSVASTALVIADAKVGRLERTLKSKNRKIKTLQKSSKATGKHWAATRAWVLSVALRLLAEEQTGMYRNPQGDVVATKLAGDIDDRRIELGFKEDSPTRDSMLKWIRAALRETTPDD